MFLLDRSGSMTGKPLQYARQALDRALTDLGPGDQLNIIAYDHEQVCCQGVDRESLQYMALISSACVSARGLRKWLELGRYAYSLPQATAVATA